MVRWGSGGVADIGVAVALVGFQGEDVSLPITLAYNHHHDTAVRGKDTALEEVDMHDPRATDGPYGNRHFIRLDKGRRWVPTKQTTEAGFPTSAMFSDGNGGEYRKTLHMAPPGYAQLVESPVELAGSPMQIDTYVWRTYGGCMAGGRAGGWAARRPGGRMADVWRMHAGRPGGRMGGQAAGRTYGGRMADACRAAGRVGGQAAGRPASQVGC